MGHGIVGGQAVRPRSSKAVCHSPSLALFLSFFLFLSVFFFFDVDHF